MSEISVYAFSIANFQRTPKEVEGLMKLSEEKYKELMEVCLSWRFRATIPVLEILFVKLTLGLFTLQLWKVGLKKSAFLYLFLCYFLASNYTPKSSVAHGLQDSPCIVDKLTTVRLQCTLESEFLLLFSFTLS